MFTGSQFQQYRQQLGFPNQGLVKDFFGAKDIMPTVDLNYLNFLNERLTGIVDKINSVVVDQIKPDDLEVFKKQKIFGSFEIIKNAGILRRLNNQGRRPEQVYFSWMRGFVISNYFLKAIGQIFEVNLAKNISVIGNDDLENPATFERTPTADFEIELGNKKMRIETQTGFQGVNDIKQHKVLEAKRILQQTGVSTLAIHFDLYNGQVAFVKLDTIEDSSINWVTRQQMEGQTVFEIDQNSFLWILTEKPLKYKDLKL